METLEITIIDLLGRIKEGDGIALFVAVTFFCILAAIYSLIYQLRVYRWPYVWGTLHTAKTDKLGATEWAQAEQDYHNKVRYTYTVHGTSYTGHRLSAMSMSASHNAKSLLEKQLKGVEKDGSNVKVYYNPGNPKKSYLIRGSVYQVVFTLVMAAVMVFAFISALNQY